MFVGEWRPAGEHLEQGHTERPDVRSHIGTFSAHNLWRRIFPGLNRRPIRADTSVGETEVLKVGPRSFLAVLDKNVDRLDVTVYDSVLVRFVECTRYLRYDLRCKRRLERTSSAELVGQADTLDQLDGEERHSVFLAGFEGPNDMWVSESGVDPLLGEKRRRNSSS